jgi:hypothetical protein
MKRTFLILLSGLAFMAPVEQSCGQAFCALRDPNRIIGELFPGFSQFKSITVTIGKTELEAIEKATGLKCDAREFGRHRLYAIFKEGNLEGFVQSRSEIVDWGIAEIIIATDTDGQLRGFRFQRCRSRYRNAAEADSVQDILRRLTSDELISFVNDEKARQSLREQASLSKKVDPLLKGILSGVAKMQVLMQIVWDDEIAGLIN